MDSNNKTNNVEPEADDWGGQSQRRGKGWFGDSSRHAEAGRKGGKARAMKMKNLNP